MSSFTRTHTSVTSLIAAAIFIGILAGFGLTTLGFGPGVQLRTQPLPENVVITPDHDVTPLDESSHDPPQSPAGDQELQYLKDIVARTNGFYARDYSLWLGWNNMRYIIETALLHGRVLNRTTIIPSFVYARACEFDIATCAAYAPMVNRGDATNTDEWRHLPIEQQMAWRIPISLMFNLTHLRQSHAVVTTADYLRLHNISSTVEKSNGQWDIETYHIKDASGSEEPSLHIIENGWYDPEDIIRVDFISDDMRTRGGWSPQGGDSSRGQVGSWNNTSNSAIYHALMDALPGGRPILNWEEVRRVVEDGDQIMPESSDEAVGDVLRANGFEVVYTYDGAAGGEAVKDVISPIHEAVPRHRIRGLFEDYRNITSRVLLLHGEVHNGRKPGSLYFTSPASRSRYSQTVLYNIRLTDNVLSLAAQLKDRLIEMNSGRLWMAAHMRRGDFARLNWAMEADFGAHLERIKRHLREGRETLLSMHGGKANTYNVPNAEPDLSIVSLDPPEENDKYYIATDERDPKNLEYLREQGAVLITDLLTNEDRREFGWSIMLTDVLALLEQATLSHAAYFYAHSLNSVAGGVMNLRAGAGADPRTALLD
ncbi:hypothetical protein HYDPIDRAFT_96607 [Hydnomerulius pinastri MD-312]|uniref:Uncharacterized protein n=1 Tax=Hydnomerulius pinastri MD-312 TaxID=994086 RepID=A0A0C9WBT7_9AGAM|nr:hypothetical protein HYDPIDRAFT_96607 [Hydnomerulius pinastri MD-312]